jgi:hypothetical protein
MTALSSEVFAALFIWLVVLVERYYSGTSFCNQPFGIPGWPAETNRTVKTVLF